MGRVAGGGTVAPLAGVRVGPSAIGKSGHADFGSRHLHPFATLQGRIRPRPRSAIHCTAASIRGIGMGPEMKISPDLRKGRSSTGRRSPRGGHSGRTRRSSRTARKSSTSAHTFMPAISDFCASPGSTPSRYLLLRKPVGLAGFAQPFQFEAIVQPRPGAIVDPVSPDRPPREVIVRDPAPVAPQMRKRSARKVPRLLEERRRTIAGREKPSSRILFLETENCGSRRSPAPGQQRPQAGGRVMLMAIVEETRMRRTGPMRFSRDSAAGRAGRGGGRYCLPGPAPAGSGRTSPAPTGPFLTGRGCRPARIDVSGGEERSQLALPALRARRGQVTQQRWRGSTVANATFSWSRAR